MSTFHARPDGDGVTITAGSQRLSFTRSADGHLRFYSAVRDGGDWHPVATVANAFVQGASFDLAADRYEVVQSAPDGVEVAFYGARPFPWDARVSATPADAWIHVRITVDAPREIALQAEPILEPWCVVWLGDADRLRWTQHDTWRQTTIAAPTRSSTGAPGNDLPAAYLYDVAHQAEIAFYADVGTMTWMGDATLARFRDIEVGPVWDAGGRYGIGMHASRRSGDRFPAGRQSFAFKLWHRRRETAPTEREALGILIEHCAPLLEAAGVAAPPTREWGAVAAGTLSELRDARAWITVGGVTGHPAYLPQPDRPTPPALELMTQVDVLAPLGLLARIDEGARAHADRIAATLGSFWRPGTGVFGNGWPAPAGEETVDSWYFFENALIKLAWVARARQDRMLQERVLSSLNSARDLAHRCQYLFPLFYLAGRNEPVGNGSNLAVSGLYAYACMLALEVSRDAAWRGEAEHALRTLAYAPLALLYHEPQELAFGSLAAGLLAEGGSEGEWLAVGKHLVDAQLRMAYWTADPVAVMAGHDIRGSFQACAGLLYPAFKENVESILPWLGSLRRSGLSPLPLRFLDLQRRNNLAFFGQGSSIPYEDLGTLELGGGTGRLGREIYGAGEVLWMALIFDTLARADDPEVCVVWLDVLDSWDRFPPDILRLAVFNPTAIEREVRLTLPHGGSVPSFTLRGGESRRMDVERN